VARPNIFAARFEHDPDDPPAYAAAEANIGELAGGRELTVRMFEILPGASLCPYHYEYVEEWLVVLSGEVELRSPAGTEALQPGDVVCFPAGPDGAHQTTNRGSAPARIVMFSPATVPSVAVYPDSGKVGVWTESEADRFMFRRTDGSVDYFDGEL